MGKLKLSEYLDKVQDQKWTTEWQGDLLSLFVEIAKASYRYYTSMRKKSHAYFWLDSFEITYDDKDYSLISADFLIADNARIPGKHWFEGNVADNYDDEQKWVCNIGMILPRLLFPDIDIQVWTSTEPPDPRDWGLNDQHLLDLIESICPYFGNRERIGFEELGSLIWDVLCQRKVTIRLHYVLRDAEKDITRTLDSLTQYEPKDDLLSFSCPRGWEIVDDKGKKCFVVDDTVLDLQKKSIRIDVYGDEINYIDASSFIGLKKSGMTGDKVGVCIISESGLRVVVYAVRKRHAYFEKEYSADYILSGIGRNGNVELSEAAGKKGLKIRIDENGTVMAGNGGRANSVDLCDYVECCFSTALSEDADTEAIHDFVVVLKDGFSLWKGKVEKAFERVFACRQGIEKMIISDTLLTYLVCKECEAGKKNDPKEDETVMIDCCTEGIPCSVIKKEPTRYAIKHGFMARTDTGVLDPDGGLDRIIVKGVMEQARFTDEMKRILGNRRDKELFWIDPKTDPADCGLYLYLKREKLFLDDSLIGTLIRDYFGRTFFYPCFRARSGERWTDQKITLIPQGAKRLGFYIFNDQERIRNTTDIMNSPILAFDMKEESIKKIGSISLDEDMEKAELEISFTGSALTVKQGEKAEPIYLKVDWKDYQS